ncbi:MAG: cell division protein ZapB [Deltaproteobacteria bacterium]|nr:cell division protein ZapB [Deltaproteobacteria bacterium]
MDLEKLKLLETKIDRFVAEHEKVRQERDALGQRLREREGLFEQLAGQVKQYEQERTELKARLERILSRLDGLDLG